MSSKKKTEKPENIAEEPAKVLVTAEEEVQPEVEEVKSEEIKSEPAVEKVEKPVENKKKSEKTPKYPIGSIVFIHKEADADLNGFKLFPQYKKYTYTVEAYDEKSEVYSLRRLNLSLRLKEADLMAPHEKSGSALFSKQY